MQGRLDEYYADVEIANDTFFDNILHASTFQVRKALKRLRRPVDKKRWEMTPPQVMHYGLE